jgi:hypothetical protein
MSQGILINATCRALYEAINSRQLCIDCQEKRIKYIGKDKKHNGIYSNMLTGFSSTVIEVPIDVMIIAEAHGGGKNGDFFRKQLSLEEELEQLKRYYLNDDLLTFHQSEMRILLSRLNGMGVSWVFTDLVKCFVWQGDDGSLVGSDNFKTATSHCSKYLEQQLDVLKPKVIISLGNRVASFFGLKSVKHGVSYKPMGLNVVHSTFPSRNTADYWIMNKGWAPVLKEVTSLLKQNETNSSSLKKRL